jgi:hypothetical protein
MPSDHRPDLPRIGWREWVSLPDLLIPRIKAKIDTGARSSSLHAFDIEVFERGRERLVRFKVHPVQRDTQHTVLSEAKLLGMRQVRNSGGQQESRPVIGTTVELLGRRWLIELTLASRDAMGFRMLLGREALRGRCLVDAGASFLAGRLRKRRA